jgi:hypothetical protein
MVKQCQKMSRWSLVSGGLALAALTFAARADASSFDACVPTTVTYVRLPIIDHPRTGLKPRTDGLLWERACRGGGRDGKQAAEQSFEAAA